jgi:hypothetical protein
MEKCTGSNALPQVQSGGECRVVWSDFLDTACHVTPSRLHTKTGQVIMFVQKHPSTVKANFELLLIIKMNH